MANEGAMYSVHTLPSTWMLARMIFMSSTCMSGHPFCSTLCPLSHRESWFHLEERKVHNRLTSPLLLTQGALSLSLSISWRDVISRAFYQIMTSNVLFNFLVGNAVEGRGLSPLSTSTTDADELFHDLMYVHLLHSLFWIIWKIHTFNLNVTDI